MTDQGAGTKGGLANIGQMMGSVGQQFYRGKRLAPTLSGGRRLLPTYDYDDNNPEAHAFIPESLFTGISPEGLFFLQAGGREGLLDTALKTAETGAMQHRMIKAFENIIVASDGSVRNTIGTLFAPIYNSGYDIAEMLAVKNLEKRDFSSFIDIESTVRNLNIRRGWVPASTNKIILANRAELAATPLPEENILPVTPEVKQAPTVPPPAPYDVTVLPELSASPRKITKYERARIIGTRARQIDNNAPISQAIDLTDDRFFRDFLKSTGRWTSNSEATLPELRVEFAVEFGVWLDPVRIATAEYEAGVINMFVVRGFADGTYQTVYPSAANI
jgi:DNA-directed RNA polymerase subunit K/omega